jgi:hypothetical protein
MLLRCFFTGSNVTIVHDVTKIVAASGTGNLTPSADTELVFRNVEGIWYQIDG